MIIDKLKEFIARFSDTHQKNNVSEVKNDEIPTMKPDMGIEDVYGPCIPDDEIDEPTPCVYGPPSWYDDKGNLDPNNPDAKRFIDEIDAVEERNRLRAELRKLRQKEIQDSLVDKPTKCVYGLPC